MVYGMETIHNWVEFWQLLWFTHLKSSHSWHSKTFVQATYILAMIFLWLLCLTSITTEIVDRIFDQKFNRGTTIALQSVQVTIVSVYQAYFLFMTIPTIFYSYPHKTMCTKSIVLDFYGKRNNCCAKSSVYILTFASLT